MSFRALAWARMGLPLWVVLLGPALSCGSEDGDRLAWAAHGLGRGANPTHGIGLLFDGVEQAKLAASDAGADDQFGVSVAISGDTALVGANGDDNVNGASAGAAYVFVRNGALWTEQAKIVAGDGAANDQFGVSVALSGDTALIGAWNDDNANGMDAGAAYVFVRSGALWTEQAKIVAGDGAQQDQFGASVSLSGDTALVGAHLNDNANGVDAGAAYVFVRNGLLWTPQAKLLASDGAGNDSFGHAVALSADTALVGARRDDNANGMDAGAAYVFARNGNAWAEQAKLLASDGKAIAYFGGSAALSADTALVGAYGEDTLKGAAYAFVRNGVQWMEQAKLVANGGAANDSFGYSVALSADAALVGAHHLSNANGVSTGAALVFVRNGVQWTQQAKLLPSDGAAFDWFGCSVALSENTALVGAYRHAGMNGALVGATYVYGIGLSNGDACAMSQECANGICIDGVCCDVLCGGGDPDDCQACSMATGAAVDGTCGLVSAGMVCRQSTAACDIEETCDGASDICPIDAFAPDGTPCLGGTCQSGLCEMGGGGAMGTGGTGGSAGTASSAGTAGEGSGRGGDPGAEGACGCRTARAAGDMSVTLTVMGLLAAIGRRRPRSVSRRQRAVIHPGGRHPSAMAAPPLHPSSHF